MPKSFRRQSYDALPALSVRRHTLRWSLRRVTVAWAIGTIWQNIAVGGACMVLYASLIGFGDFTFGLMTAVPFVAAFFQLWATVLIERTGLTKFQFLAFGTAHRLMFIVMAFIPLVLPVPSAAAVAALLGLLLISWALEAFARPAWVTWMGVLIPPRIRGRYLARRQQITTLVKIVGAIGVGLLLSYRKEAGVEMTWPYQLRLGLTIVGLLIVAGSCGAIDVLMFGKIPEVIARKDSAPESPLHPESLKLPGGRWRLIRYLLLDPMRNREFRRFVIYSACTLFAVTLGGVYYLRNMLDNLVADWKYGVLVTYILFTAIGPIVAILVARAIGRAADRYGRKPVLVLGTVMTLTSLLPWFFVGPTMPPWLLLMLCALPPVLGWIAWGTIEMTKMNILLGFAHGDGRSRYVAASQLYVSLGGILGGLTGGALTSLFGFLQDSPIRLGPFLYNNWHVAFAASFLARMLAIVFAARLHDPGAAPTRVVAMAAGTRAVNALSAGLFYPLRVFGWKRWPPNAKPDRPNRTRNKKRPPKDS